MLEIGHMTGTIRMTGGTIEVWFVIMITTITIEEGEVTVKEEKEILEAEIGPLIEVEADIGSKMEEENRVKWNKVKFKIIK